MHQKHSISSCTVDMVAINIVVDIARSLQHQIAVHTPMDLIFLQKRSRTTSYMHSVSESCCYLVKKYVGVAVRLHLYSNFLVQPKSIITDV